MQFDAVVVGAGNGGLTAALSLARNGLQTLLVEKHNIPGGCATSFLRGRFEFEVALHQLSGLGRAENPGPLRTFLQGLGVLDKVEWVEMENLYRVVVPGQLDVTLKADREEMVNALVARFPKEEQGIRGFVDLLYNFFYQVIQAFFLRDKEASKEKYPLVAKYALKTTEEVFNQYFKDPALKLALGVYWPYMGLPPSRLSFIDFASLLFSYLEWKPYHIKGGSQALSNAILEMFLQAGGKVLFNTKVSEILVKEGRVIGVRLEDDRVVRTDYVVSNASTVSTYTELIDPSCVPREQIEILGGSNIGPSAFTMFLGMDKTPEELGINEATIFVCPHLDMDLMWSSMKQVETDEDGIIISTYNVSDPDASPPGTSQIAIASLKYGEAWLSVPPEQYYDTKYRCAQAILDRVEKIFPGFINHIEEMEIATPLTHFRYLGTPGGAIYGFDQYVKDSNMFVPPVSPIKGLYFAGAWAGSGGFQPTLMSGGTAAKAVLRQRKEEKGV